MKTKKAIVMAAGKGLRLSPLTVYDGSNKGNMPKAVIPIVNVPNIVRLINEASSNGITQFYVCEGYMAEEVQSALKQVQTEGVVIKHIVDTKGRTKPQLTKDIVTKEYAQDFSGDDHFWVLHTDISMYQMPLTEMENEYLAAEAINPKLTAAVGCILRDYYYLGISKENLTISSSTGRPRAKMGILPLTCDGLVKQILLGRDIINFSEDELYKLNDDVRIKGFSSHENLRVFPVNASFYLISKDVFDFYPEKCVSFDDSVFKALVPDRLYAFLIEDGFPNKEDIRIAQWYHIADLKDYYQAQYGYARWVSHSTTKAEQYNPEKGNNILCPDVELGNVTLKGTIVLPNTSLKFKKHATFLNCLIGGSLHKRFCLESLARQEYSSQYIIPYFDSYTIGSLI